MKNIKRLFLLATLAIITVVVFEADFKELKAEINSNMAIANNE